MPLQKHDDFFPKCSRAMMLFLITNIRTRLFDSRYPDAERAITPLPRKASQFPKRLMNPLR
jgi:hypothetical protein